MDVSTARALLDEESAQLDELVAQLSRDEWLQPTPAAGWTIADQIAHLHWTDVVATQSAQQAPEFDQLLRKVAANGAAAVDSARIHYADLPPSELLFRWREGRERLTAALTQVDPGTKLSWFGPPMRSVTMVTARIMETWAHGLDVHDALGVEKPAGEPLRAVVRIGVRTLGFSFASRGEGIPDDPVRVAVTLPSGEVLEHGPADAVNSVTGDAWAFAAVVTQRRHSSDVALEAAGPVAMRWLEIAQAFAGEPTLGPGPGERVLTGVSAAVQRSE